MAGRVPCQTLSQVPHPLRLGPSGAYTQTPCLPPAGQLCSGSAETSARTPEKDRRQTGGRMHTHPELGETQNPRERHTHRATRVKGRHVHRGCCISLSTNYCLYFWRDGGRREHTSSGPGRGQTHSRESSVLPWGGLGGDW